MKKPTLFIVLMVALSWQSLAQYNVTLEEKVKSSDLIFEGRVLTSECSWNADHSGIYTSHKVLVLKKFKGNFVSDTIVIVTNGGEIGDRIYSEDYTLGLGPDEEGVFFCKKPEHGFMKINRDDYYRTLFDQLGFIRIHSDPGQPPAICFDHPYRDIEKEVYQPIVDLTGTPMIRLRLNHREEMELKKKVKP